MDDKPCSMCGRKPTEVSFYYRSNGRRRAECKECRQGCNKKYHDAHRAEIQAYQQSYHENRREELRSYGREYYQKNRERIQAANKSWKSSHQEEHRSGSRRWYHANTERAKTNVRKWQRNNGVRKRLYSHKRRALSSGSWTPAEWESLKAFYDFTCLACGRKEPDIELTFDHVIPLSKGGPNTIDNCQPLCRSCNSSKQARDTDYRESFPRRIA